jgi:dolichol-phosphate mannosyltransferase
MPRPPGPTLHDSCVCLLTGVQGLYTFSATSTKAQRAQLILMLSIVLPAYNEANDLPELIERIGRTMADYGKRFQIVVVDDGSVDGTAEVAEAAAAHLPVKVVRHERNGGLGRALRTGLLVALKDGKYVVTMDADNSHDPELIPLMVERLQHGHDVVVASRFQNGGREVGVGLYRRALSHTASRVLRWAFPLEGVRDYSSGYRAYRAELLQHLVAEYGEQRFIEESGFACMLEALLKLGARKARIAEVPLVLRYDRKRGASKMRIARTVRRYGAVVRNPLNGSGDEARATSYRPGPPALPSERASRVLSLIVASLALTLAAPVMLAVAVLIKLTSPGPVLYAQTRVGRDKRASSRNSRSDRRRIDYGGRPFKLYKFRTMRVHAERGQGAVWAVPGDQRVTLVGRILRHYRVDELPQLFNVLRGDMNLVGPRPERPQIVEQLGRRINEYKARHGVRPGITGWAQINRHYDQTLEDVRNKLAYDLEYIARRSVFEDLRIMFRTIPVIVSKRGAL